MILFLFNCFLLLNKIVEIFLKYEEGKQIFIYLIGNYLFDL